MTSTKVMINIIVEFILINRIMITALNVVSAEINMLTNVLVAMTVLNNCIGRDYGVSGDGWDTMGEDDKDIMNVNIYLYNSLSIKILSVNASLKANFYNHPVYFLDAAL